MAKGDFAGKFNLVLTALNLSRGRLAQSLGIDKSVVSRWASGVQTPTDHNLTLLTEAVARHHPGFSRRDWDLETSDLSSRLRPKEDEASEPERPSIAVLPFHNMSDDPQQEYFADGIAEEIITALSRFKSLFVIARNSSFTYKGRAVDIKQVGRELGVRYVLEGSVRKAGNRIRVTGQLAHTQTGTHLWSERFDAAVEDIFDLQDQVTASVVAAIAPRIDRAEIDRIRRKPIESLDAYDCFLRGRAKVHERSRQSCEEALRLSHRAIELDPDFATPYGLAAGCYMSRKNDGWVEDGQRETAETRRLALQAQKIGRDDGFALAWAGRAMAFVCREYDIAEAMVEQAIVVNPNLATAWLCRGTVSLYFGRYDEGIEQLAHVLRMSPIDPESHLFESFIGWGYLLQGRLAEAVEWSNRARSRRADCGPALRVSAAANALAGNLPAARKAVTEMLSHAPQLTLTYIESIAPFRRLDDLAKAMDGLRLAGLPD